MELRHGVLDLVVSVSLQDASGGPVGLQEVSRLIGEGKAPVLAENVRGRASVAPTGVLLLRLEHEPYLRSYPRSGSRSKS